MLRRRCSKLKKIVLAIAVVSFAILLSTSFANAALDADITVANANINHGGTQQITVTTNQAGMGILIVIQPGPSQSLVWTSFLNSHPVFKAIWNSLSNSVRTQIISQTNGKIFSYALVNISPKGGGSHAFSFPTDFTGINGAPSTAMNGKYKVLLAFISFQAQDIGRPQFHCCLCQIDFDCGSWFVVPEVPLGTVVPLLTALLALPTYMLISRRRFH
jgi:hypothetical protein